jgi:myo-inositol-1(or 4)-monophosphatase
MNHEPDLDNPADRRSLMLAAADHAAESSAHQLRGWLTSKYLSDRLPIPEDQDEGIVRALKNHAEAWLRNLYEAPVYLSGDRRPWMDDEPAWVINLQEGWQNLLTGIEHGAISYTLITLRGPFISVVSPVFSDRRYMAAAGLGAWQQDERNEPRRVYASSAETLASSSLTFGLPADDNSVGTLKPATRMRPKAGALRLSGCSSLDLVDVARGATQGHFEASVNHADVAAALLILKEAGGVITDWQGEYLNPQRVTYPMNLAASNGRVHGEMLQVLTKIKPAPAAANV